MATVPLGPAVADITGVRAGDRNLMVVHLTNAGLPYDLTGKTPQAQARKTPSMEGEPSLTAVVTITDAVGGVIEVEWPGDAVRTLLGGNDKWAGVWDLQVDDGVTDPVTLVGGAIHLVMDVTRVEVP